MKKITCHAVFIAGENLKEEEIQKVKDKYFYLYYTILSKKYQNCNTF